MSASFSKEHRSLQIAWDSTSLGTLMECPRKYQLSMCAKFTDDKPIGFAPRKESVHLIFGQLYHGALERYDHARVAGADHDEATDQSLQYCLTSTWDHTKKRPWASDDPNKNRFTLVRTVIWYLEHFRDDALETVTLASDKPAVELSFRLETDYKSFTGEKFLICGHLDRVATLNGDTFIVDRKTSKNTINERFFDGFNPDNQFSTYTFAAKALYGLQVKGLIVDGAQVAVTFSRFLRGMVFFHDDQLEEWYGDIGYYLSQAQAFAQANYWPMNRKSCGNYGGCPFRPICSHSPSTRMEWLEKSYTPRVWDPLQVRGDI
jgi:hypothetical protein